MAPLHSQPRTSKQIPAWLQPNPRNIAKGFQNGIYRFWTIFPNVRDKVCDIASTRGIMSGESVGTRLQRNPSSTRESTPRLEGISSGFVDIPKCTNDEVEYRLDGLQDAREVLMGSRYQLRMERKRVQAIRDQTVLQEGNALSELRRFLHEKSISLPSHIDETFEQVYALRDKLGLREVEYNEAEQSYHLEEMRYTEQESAFLEMLNAKDVAATPTAHPDTWEVINAIPDETSLVPVTEHSELVNHDRKTLSASPSVYAGKGDIKQSPHQDWLEYKTGVNKWLLDALCMSSLQKAYQTKYLNDIDPSGDTDTNRWWDQIAKNWYLVNFAGAQFHTGHVTYMDGEATERSFLPLDISDTDLLDTNAPPPPIVIHKDQDSETTTRAQSQPSDRLARTREPAGPGDVSPRTEPSAYGTTDFGPTRSTMFRTSSSDIRFIHSEQRMTNSSAQQKSVELLAIHPQSEDEQYSGRPYSGPFLGNESEVARTILPVESQQDTSALSVQQDCAFQKDSPEPPLLERHETNASLASLS